MTDLPDPTKETRRVADPNARDAKLIQYLNEAYGKEKQLETALQAHIAMTTRAPYKKRLQQHLKETKAHAREVQRRIKKLGGTAEESPLPDPAARVQSVARKGAALAQGQIHVIRGTGEQEKLLKNAKTEYANEAEEIANYTAIETLATAVGDRETAQLARGIRREEERMAAFLEKLIPTLTKAVATDEIPADQRPRARRSSRRSTRSRTSTARSSSASRSSRSKASTSGRAKSTARKPRSAARAKPARGRRRS
jgi:ferritin-like metal-binding protein YciE